MEQAEQDDGSRPSAPCWGELPEVVWLKIFSCLLLDPWNAELQFDAAFSISLVCKHFNALVWQAAAGAAVSVHTGRQNVALLRKMPGIRKICVTFPPWHGVDPSHDFNEDFRQFLNQLLGEPQPAAQRSMTTRSKQQQRSQGKTGSGRTKRGKGRSTEAAVSNAPLDQVLPNLKELHLSVELTIEEEDFDDIGPNFCPSPGTSLDLAILKRCPPGMQLTLTTMRCPSAFVEGLHSLAFTSTDVSDVAMMEGESISMASPSEEAEARLAGSRFESFAALRGARSLRVLSIEPLFSVVVHQSTVTTAFLQRLPPTLEVLELQEAGRFRLPSPHAFPPSLKTLTLTGCSRGGAASPYRPGGLPLGLEELTLDLSSVSEELHMAPATTSMDVSCLPDSLSVLTIRGTESTKDAPFQFLGNWPRSLSRLKIHISPKFPRLSGTSTPTFHVPLHPQVVVELKLPEP